jgi:hypothetical protein
VWFKRTPPITIGQVSNVIFSAISLIEYFLDWKKTWSKSETKEKKQNKKRFSLYKTMIHTAKI